MVFRINERSLKKALGRSQFTIKSVLLCPTYYLPHYHTILSQNGISRIELRDIRTAIVYANLTAPVTRTPFRVMEPDTSFLFNELVQVVFTKVVERRLGRYAVGLEINICETCYSMHWFWPSREHDTCASLHRDNQLGHEHRERTSHPFTSLNGTDRGSNHRRYDGL